MLEAKSEQMMLYKSDLNLQFLYKKNLWIVGSLSRHILKTKSRQLILDITGMVLLVRTLDSWKKRMSKNVPLIGPE